MDKVETILWLIGFGALCVAAHQLWVAGKKAQMSFDARQRLRKYDQPAARRNALGK